MAIDGNKDAERAALNAEIRDWRQADVVPAKGLTPRVLADLSLPLSEPSVAARDKGEDGLVYVPHQAELLAIVSQSCDVIAPTAVAPFVALAPVVEVEDTIASVTRKGWRPRLAPVPAISPVSAVDLTRVITVEKAVLRTLDRQPGVADEEQARIFRWVVERHWARPAFPNELELMLKPLARRFQARAGKNSMEGLAVDALEQARLAASGDWGEENLDVALYLLVEDEAAFEVVVGAPDNKEGKAAPEIWAALKAEWQGLIEAPYGPIASIEVGIDTLTSFKAQEYLDSDHWDSANRFSPPDA
jgi:hypothetical protein